MHPQISSTVCGVSWSKTLSAFCRTFLVQTSVGRTQIIPFLLTKNPWTDTFLRDISPAELCSTARDGIPKGFLTRELDLLSCSLRFAWSNSAGLPCYKNLCSRILNIPLPYGMRLKVSPKGRHTFEQLLGFHVRRVVLWWYCSCVWLPRKKRTKEPVLEWDGSLEKCLTCEPKNFLGLVGAQWRHLFLLRVLQRSRALCRDSTLAVELCMEGFS